MTDIPNNPSTEDWWVRFQGGKTSRNLNETNYQTEDRRKRAIFMRFLHSSMHKMKERATGVAETTISRSKTSHFSNSLSEFVSSDVKSQVNKSYSTKSLRSNLNSSRNTIWRRSPAETPGRRIICVECTGRNQSLASIVATVCGGGLEKVVFHNEVRSRAEMHFLSSKQAARFMEYARRSSLCTLNGHPLRISWAEPSVGLDEGHLPLPVYILEEVEGYRASRVIAFCQPVRSEGVSQGPRRRGYPIASEHFSADFNVEKIKWDLVQFGEIVEVSPMVSSKLGISIQFSDIRSAILVMHTLRQKSSLLHAKYSSWTARYVRDVTCRPCLLP